MDDKNQKNDLKKEDKTKKVIEEAQKDVEDLLKDMEEQLGVKKENIRVIKIRLPKRNIKSILFDAIGNILLNIVLVLSISGYLTWTKDSSMINIIFFTLTYSLIDLFLKNIITLFFIKHIIKTFGMILALPTFLSVFLTIAFTDFVVITSNQRVLLMFILLIGIKYIIKKMIFNYRRK